MSTSRMRVFIVSTAESLSLARALATALDRENKGSDFKAVLWDEGVFSPSTYPVAGLARG